MNSFLFFLDLHPLFFHLFWELNFKMLRHICLDLFNGFLSQFSTVLVSKAIQLLLNFVVVSVNYQFPNFLFEDRGYVFCPVV